MAELLYVYVEKIYSGVNRQSFNFSNDYEVIFEEDNLMIHKKEDSTLPSNFFGKNINNISLVVGKNGVGKSSILDLISFSHKNRKKIMPSTEYIIVHHVTDTTFYCEGSKSLCKRVFKYDIHNRIYQEGFYFEIINGQPQIINRYNNEPLSLNYIRSLPDFSWVINETPDEDTTRSEDYLIRNYRTDVNASDIYQFLQKNQGFLNSRNEVALEFKQEKQYSTNSSYILFYIYHGDLNLLQEVDYQIRNIDDITFKYITSAKREDYLRNTQDLLYGKYLKSYFILRLLEKDIIKIYNILLDDYNNQKYDNEASHEVLNYRFEYLKNESIELQIERKIDYLLKIYNHILSLEHHNSSYKIKGGVLDSKRILFFLKLIEEIHHIEDEQFLTNNSLAFNLGLSSNNNKFFELFNFKEENLYGEDLRIYLKNLSAGEKVYINTFSLIYHHLNSPYRNVLLILDEPDLNFHPEWSRQFINNLVRLINKSQNKNVQIVISSHSPFLMTDIPRHNIFLIKENEGKKYVEKTDISFAANLYDLVSTSFFLEYPIGEFARGKLKSLSDEKRPNERDQKILEILDDSFLKELLQSDSLEKM